MALRFQCIICATEACRYCLEKRQVSLPSPSQPVSTGPTRTEVIELRILQLENENFKLTQRVTDLESKTSHPLLDNMVNQIPDYTDYTEEISSPSPKQIKIITKDSCPFRRWGGNVILKERI